MEIIQQIAVKAVEEIYESVKATGLGDIGKTIKELEPVVSRTVLRIVKAFLEEMDEALVTGAKSLRREDGITVKEKKVPRTWLTELGELTYERTYFRLPDGSFSYLLDHVIGVEAYERISKELIADILQAATVKSYQHAIDSTKQEITRQTVHNRLVATDDLVMPVNRAEETPETLDIFADEDHVHLTPKGKAIVPLVTITEGMDVSDPKRHKTICPIHLAAYGMAPDAFRENVLAVLTERYDLEKVKQINIHADCGPWIQGLQQLIPHSRLVLDGYHLEKELRSFLRLEGAGCYARAIRESMRKEDGYEAFERYCESIYRKQTTDDGREKVRKFVEYCANHWSAIVVRMSKETCGSCTEPQVSHVLSDRLSRNPIAWSKEGLNRMTMLVVYTKNGGRVCAKDVRIRVNEQAKAAFHEDGYARYCNYAKKQSDEMLNVKHDWSLFEHECDDLGKVDGVFLLRKSVGALTPLSELVS
jgi:Uncharacterised protein family (UPF0236).